jgi:hypothetical protein
MAVPKTSKARRSAGKTPNLESDIAAIFIHRAMKTSVISD